MMKTLLISLVIIVFTLTPSYGQEKSSTPAYLDLAWADLLPEGEVQRIAQLQKMQALQNGFDHFGADQMPQIQTFNVVESLEGQRVRIGGYILPLEFSSYKKVSEFLLVPYIGACIHVPPPPPNQLIFVSSETPIEIEAMWDPVFVEGIMRTARAGTPLADTAYTIELIEVSPYGR